MSSDFLYRFVSRRWNLILLWFPFGSERSCNVLSVYGQRHMQRCRTLQLFRYLFLGLNTCSPVCILCLLIFLYVSVSLLLAEAVTDSRLFPWTLTDRRESLAHWALLRQQQSHPRLSQGTQCGAEAATALGAAENTGMKTHGQKESHWESLTRGWRDDWAGKSICSCRGRT